MGHAEGGQFHYVVKVEARNGLVIFRAWYSSGQYEQAKALCEALAHGTWHERPLMVVLRHLTVSTMDTWVLSADEGEPLKVSFKTITWR